MARWLKVPRRLQLVGPGTAPRLLALLALALGSQIASGQELEARAYAPNPVGARFLVMSWSHSDGDMLLNASSPIKDFEVRANTYSAGTGGTFALWDRLASVAIGLPYVDGTASGLLDGIPERVNRAGVADLRVLTPVRLQLQLQPEPGASS